MSQTKPPVLAPGKRRFQVPRTLRTPLGIIGGAVAVAWIVIAIVGPFLVPHDPVAQELPRLRPPSPEAWFGTDEGGRDVFSRVLAGARITIPLSVLLVVMSMFIGATVGAIAGYFGSWIGETLMRITDLVMCFPTVVLAMVIAAALGPSLMNAVLAALVVSWPSYARVTRSQVLSLRQANFVLSGRLLGYSPWKSITRDVAPNVFGPVIVLASLDIGTATLLLSGLSFLGLGSKPPAPEWGSMVSASIANFDKWWLGLFPGLAISTVVVAFNLLGDALRDALDPATARSLSSDGGQA